MLILINHCCLFLQLFGVHKSKIICYQSVWINRIHSIVLEASREGMKKLSVLRKEQCEDECLIGKWDHEYIL
jgi:hypothetical protein